LVVSHELLRVAILWHEMWHEGLEEASRLYFTEKNPEGMIATLAPLHDTLEAVGSYSMITRHSIDCVPRGQQPRGKPHLSRRLDEILQRLVRQQGAMKRLGYKAT
jgi:hypothetical protein